MKRAMLGTLVGVGFVLPFFLLVLEFAEIHDPADRGYGGR